MRINGLIDTLIWFLRSITERVRRSIGVVIFSFFFVLVLIAFPEFPRWMIFVFSLVFIVVGTYQIRRDYKNSKKEDEKIR